MLDRVSSFLSDNRQINVTAAHEKKTAVVEKLEAIH